MANPVGPPGTWTQVFEDTFDGPGLNTANWTALQGANINQVTTQASAVSVSGGNLRVGYAGAVNSNPASGFAGPSTGPRVLLGNCIEASINFPNGSNWSAWWADGYPWPNNGEEDIAEILGGKLTALNYQFVGGPSNGPAPSGSWYGAFHTYTLVRGSTTLQCWWDGQLVRSVGRNDAGGAQSMIINMGTGSTGNTILVDYVRMWTPGGTGGSSPTVVTNPATNITDTAVTLNGTVNPNSLATTYQFEYGATTGYGTATPGSPGSVGAGTAAISESANVTGLTASTGYHYRLNATNSGGLTHGSDQAFTTQVAAGGGGGGGGGALPALTYSNTQSTASSLTETAGASLATSANNTVTTGSYTPTANTLQVAVLTVANGNSVTASSLTLTDSAGGTWTQLVRLPGSSSAPFSDVSVWCKDAGSSPSAQTVTATALPSTVVDVSLMTRQFNGARPAASQSGVTATGSGIAAATCAITPGTTGSQVVGAFGWAWSQIAMTANAATTIYGQFNGATGGDTGALFKATALSTSGTPVSPGFTNTLTAGDKSAFALAEILPAAGAGTLTSTSFTPSTGDIIVVKLVAEDSAVTFATPTGGGWTYTSQVSDTTASHVSARIYTANVTAGGTPQTVAETPTWGSFANGAMTVELWTGGQLAAIPATADTRGSGTPSTTLTTTAANSMVTWLNGDWAEVNGSVRTYNTTSATPSEDGYFFSSGRLTAYSAYQSAVTAGSQTLGLTAPGGQTWTLAGIEIQGAGGGGGGGGGTLSYRAAPAVTASSGNVSSWTVSKQAGTAAGDWIFIYVYGCNYSATVACTGFSVAEDPNNFGALIYRYADGTEGSTFTITGLGGGAPVTSLIATIDGATSALDPPGTPAPVSGGLSTSIPVPSITLGNSGDWLLWFGANESDWGLPGYAISPPPGFTTRATNGAQTANATVLMADNQNPAAGATSSKTGTIATTSYYSGAMVAVTAGVSAPSTSTGTIPAAAGATAGNATVAVSGSSRPTTMLASAASTAGQAQASIAGSSSPPGILPSGAAAALNASVQASPGIVWFPAKNLGIKAELLLNGVWTDISRYVYQRNPIQITGMGRADWTSQIQAAQMTLTINNRDGRFSPKNNSGAYFPFITRNTQIRVSVSAQSSTGAAYSGIRFWGEVSEWPVRWDPSESDITAEVVANGIWRRISQLQTTLGSAFTRYNTITLTGASQPRCYWPMEDGTGATQLVPYDSVAGTPNATFTVLGTNEPSLAASTDFRGSDGIVVLNAAEITCTVPAGGSATSTCTRFALSVPAAGDSASGTTNWDLAEINSAGTVAKFEILLMTTGHLRIYLRNSAGTVLATADTTTNIQGTPCLVSAELTPSGGSVNFALRIITQGATGITESMTGTLASASVGAISSVRFSRGNTLMDTAVGHLSITYGAVPSMVNAANALGGYVGEKAMDRFTRICAEMGITTQTIGPASTTAAMGPQTDDHLADVLQVIEDTDCGLLYETRDQFGLGYRSSASMANQVIAASFSYTAAVLDQALAPTYDDQLIRNNIVVTNWSGYSQQAVLTAGPMSIANPPNGVGNGYSYTRSVSAAADSQTAGIATFLLNLGTVDEVRFPVVGLKMARTANAALFTAVPGLRTGDYFQITNPPSFLTSTPVRLLAWGRSETLSAKQWDFEFNAVSEVPWETGFSPGTTQLAQIPGGSTVVSTAPGAGGLGGIIANGSITPAMLSQGITVHTLGGSAITISSGPPPTPNVNDIWIDSDTGLISQWTGTAWIPFKFDASQTIQAATIVTSNIAASAITSSLIAAGTVVAGIVDATTITGAQFVATGTGGEVLIYSGTPAAGNLIGAWSGTAGSDAFSNAFAANISTSNLTAFQPGSSPVALETWHTLGPIGNGWTTQHGRYRRTAENEIQLDVSLVAGGSPTYGLITWPNTMPAAYRPIVTRRLAGVPSAGTACHSTINSTGAVSSNIPSPAATFDCCGRVPLD